MSFRSDWREGAVFSWLICGGNRSSAEGASFHGLSVGETAAPPKVENVGGGRTPPQISHRKDQPGSLGIEEKISQASHLAPCAFWLRRSDEG
jgi:hypothetical protein